VQAILNSYEKNALCRAASSTGYDPSKVFQTNTAEWTWEAASGRLHASPGP